MNLSIQRYKKGHPNYTEAMLLHDGVSYGSVFGEMRESDTGKFIAYTMERKDTLIADGKYNFTYHNSPSNKCICPHIYSATCPKERYILIHPANWAYQLKGCTAVGSAFDRKAPGVINSKSTFNSLMKLLNNKNGTITYKTY